jgi:hypothetical protein
MADQLHRLSVTVINPDGSVGERGRMTLAPGHRGALGLEDGRRIEFEVDQPEPVQGQPEPKEGEG